MISVPESIRTKTQEALLGDSEALGQVFTYFRPRLLAHALRICGNTPVAQDAVQDTFISAFTHLSSLRNPALFYPWLKKILLNHCYMLLRKERSVEFTDVHLKTEALLHRSIDEYFENTGTAQQVYGVMKALSDELRSCIMLRYFSNVKSYEEIAVMLDIPIGTVRSRLSSGREKLAKLFTQVNEADDTALKEAKHWSGFYINQWNNLHSDLKTRNEFFEHLHPSLNIRFTSGKKGTGRKIIESEINNDLLYGSRVEVNDVITSGNISVIEADNINHPDFPDRCAPKMSLVLFRNNDRVNTAHIFDSPRQ